MSLDLTNLLNSKNITNSNFVKCVPLVEQYLNTLDKLGIDVEPLLKKFQRTIYSYSNNPKVNADFYNLSNELDGKVTFSNKFSYADAKRVTFKLDDKNTKSKRIYILNINMRDIEEEEKRCKSDVYTRRFIHEMSHIVSSNYYTNGIYKVGILTNEKDGLLDGIREENVKIINEAVNNAFSMIIWNEISGKKDFLDMGKEVARYSLESKYIYSLLRIRYTDKEILQMYLENRRDKVEAEILRHMKYVNEKFELLSEISNLQIENKQVKRVILGNQDISTVNENMQNKIKFIAALFDDLKERGSSVVEDFLREPTMKVFKQITDNY